MRRALSLLFAGATLAGCTLEPRYVRPTPAVPTAWPSGDAYLTSQRDALPALSYREVFRDPKLTALIDQALVNNQSLRAAMANVEIARAGYRLQRSTLFPSVDAAADAGQVRTRQATAAEADVQRSYQASLAAAFELDLFGRLRSLSRTAQEQYFATEAGARAARLTLVSEVARAYLTLAADRTLQAIAADTVDSAARTVTLTKARLDGGIAARTDLAQAETALQAARSDQVALITQVAQDRNALELLVGGPVADGALPANLAAVDDLLGEAPAGLDSHILLRRPDVLAAEHRLRAANAQIGAARAAFFPTISLTGLAGYASPQLSGLVAERNLTWQAAGGADLPIFAGGANLANLAGAKAERRLAVAEYQGAIQAAFRDVADALARRGTIRQQIEAKEALQAAAADSFELSDARYRAGVDPYLATLVAQRTLYVARQGLTQTQLDEALNLVALYAALGGDPAIETLPVIAAPRT
ncbi:efflux transporter outer membrane subunit [Phenylobacterium sp. LjRoot219]|uniref:efflux transporter outer membrane subunit n=1 Tax=Phenylobacterium sp. LjRoot219 TaxID=3342283 RepID=UPI003ECC4A88